jgi:hypothetical protein
MSLTQHLPPDVVAALQKRIDPTRLKYVPISTKDKGKPTEAHMMAPYIDTRDIVDRLNTVLGLGNWWVEHERAYSTVKGFAQPMPVGHYLTIVIRGLDGVLIRLTNVGEDTGNEEGVKGGFTDSIRRAASMGNICGANDIYNTVVTPRWLPDAIPSWERHLFLTTYWDGKATGGDFKRADDRVKEFMSIKDPKERKQFIYRLQDQRVGKPRAQPSQASPPTPTQDTQAKVTSIAHAPALTTQAMVDEHRRRGLAQYTEDEYEQKVAAQLAWASGQTGQQYAALIDLPANILQGLINKWPAFTDTKEAANGHNAPGTALVVPDVLNALMTNAATIYEDGGQQYTQTLLSKYNVQSLTGLSARDAGRELAQLRNQLEVEGKPYD